MYPLSSMVHETDDEGLKMSSSKGRNYSYWNIAFYNTVTKQTRLLSDEHKLAISSIELIEKEAVYSVHRYIKNDGKIYYRIITTDYNKDGRLGYEDPQYLFMSDLSGENFKQISPIDHDLINWQTIPTSKKVLIQARSAGKKGFDNEGEIMSFIYDLEKENIEQIFSDSFNLETKKLLLKQWSKQ